MIDHPVCVVSNGEGPDIWDGSGLSLIHIFYELGVYTMATTGELRAIIEELELVDIGDAANYLGEEAANAEKNLISSQATLYVDGIGNFVMDNCSAKQ